MTEHDRDEFARWLNDLQDGDLSPTDAHRLELRLRDDWEAREMYAASMELHANLEWRLRCGSVPSELDQTAWSRAMTESGPSVDEAAATVIAPTASGASPLRLARPIQLSRFAMAVLIVVLLTAAVSAGRLIVNYLTAQREVVASQSGGSLRFGEQGNGSDVAPGSNPSRGTRRIGNSVLPGVALANVLVFTMPKLDNHDKIESARLEWTYKSKDGKPQFNVDLYGLGYVRADAVLGKGFWEGNEDTSLRAEYGMEGPRDRRVSLIEHSVVTPKSRLGRVAVENRSLAQFMQSLYDDGAREGDLVVFRLNADRESARNGTPSGYAVVHPPARAGISKPAELPLLRVTSKRPMPADAYSVADAVVSTQAIAAHWSGGSSTSRGDKIVAGWSDWGTRRVGSSSNPSVALTNVLVFPLPALEEVERVQFVQLEWTCLRTTNDPQFSIDLYGLGFTHSDWYQGPCYWEGNLDTSLRSKYGLEGAPERQVTLIDKSVMRPGTSPGRIVIENKQLRDFLRSLYADGAQAGDLVVFRLNADTSTRKLPRSSGYDVVHAPVPSQGTTHMDLPTLRLSGR